MAHKSRKVTKAVFAVVVIAAVSFGIGRGAFGVNHDTNEGLDALAQTDAIEPVAAVSPETSTVEPVRSNDVGRTDIVGGVAIAVVELRLEGNTVVATVSAMNQNLESVQTGSWGWVTPNGLGAGADAITLPAGGAVNSVITTPAVVGENMLVYAAGDTQVVVNFTVTSQMVEVQP